MKNWQQWLVDPTQNCSICKTISQIVQNWKKDILLHIQRGTKASIILGSKRFTSAMEDRNGRSPMENRTKKKHPYMSLPALAHKFATDLDSNKCP
jgi:hypothetical protein